MEKTCRKSTSQKYHQNDAKASKRVRDYPRHRRFGAPGRFPPLSGAKPLPLPPLCPFGLFITFCHTLSNVVISCFIWSYFVILCHILSHHVISCHTLSYPRQSFLRFTGYSFSDVRFLATDPDTTRHNAPQYTRK